MTQLRFGKLNLATSGGVSTKLKTEDNPVPELSKQLKSGNNGTIWVIVNIVMEVSSRYETIFHNKIPQQNYLLLLLFYIIS